MLCNIPLNKQGCNSPLHRLERLLRLLLVWQLFVQKEHFVLSLNSF
jgi:hypothetical protein